jgi:hypothetical protein
VPVPGLKLVCPKCLDPTKTCKAKCANPQSAHAYVPKVGSPPQIYFPVVLALMREHVDSPLTDVEAAKQYCALAALDPPVTGSSGSTVEEVWAKGADIDFDVAAVKPLSAMRATYIVSPWSWDALLGHKSADL